MLTSGSSWRPTPSTSTIVFCSSRSCGCVSMSNCSVTWNSCASSRAIEISCSGRPRIGSPIERQAWVNASTERSARHVAGIEMHLGDTAVVAGQKADQHVGEVVAGLAVEPAHDAEIDDGERAVGIDEQIAGVHVGVEEAVAEHLVEKRGAGFAQQVGDIVPGRDQRRRGRRCGCRRRARSSARCARCAANRSAAPGSSGRRRNSRPVRRRPPPRSAGPSRSAPIAASVSTTSTGFSRRRLGCVRSANRASHRNRSRSRAKARSMPGRNTLTATSRPSVVIAKCTCAIDAAAIAVSSKAANRASERAGRTRPRQAARQRARKTAAAGPAAAPDRRRSRRRADRHGSPGFGRA